MRRIKLQDNERVETGPVEFEYVSGEADWPGVFIRGDNAACYAMRLEAFLDEEDTSAFVSRTLRSLIRELRGCIITPKEPS